MIEERNTPIIFNQIDSCFPYPPERLRRSLTIFLGFTSNMVTSGLREVIL